MEKPNLIYIEKLARGEEHVKQTLINVIKEEFPDELKCYQECVSKNNFRDIEDIVHRIKHKLSILGLVESYKETVVFEENLREEILIDSQKKAFETTLKTIEEYLKTI